MAHIPSMQLLLKHLEKLHQVGTALSRERNLPSVLELILAAAQDLTGADGGTLYRTTGEDQAQALRFTILHTRSLGLHYGGTSGQSVTLPDLPLYQADGRPNDRLIATYAALHDHSVVVADAYIDPLFNFEGTRQFDARTGYRSQSFLTVPMKNHEQEIIGVLQLINAIDPHTRQVRAFTAQDQRLVESLASQAAIVISNHLLIEQLEHLFASFVTLINTAIDKKSPYTRGHCERVPELTMMLAEAAHASTEGPLASFHMTERDRYELHMAGLLHDCGKIATPVHVVDKSTKLQTIRDGIATVDTRFEVLKRDAEIAMLRQQLALRPVQDAQAEAALAQACQQQQDSMDAERDFQRQCNLGSESMRESDQQRVHRIASQWRWRAPDGAKEDCLSPEEVENLSIRAGTLTEEERDIIKQHIVITNEMLEKLPWPRHLRNVPEYAGGHHERMDGKGYPKGLKREEMSWQARMLGLADIFEALTAADRPYKQPMPLSQALAVMGKMVANGHIDPDLFDVFVRQGVPMRYAQAYLAPEQADLPQVATAPE